MGRNGMLLPPMMLVGWTLCVLLLIVYQRLRAALAGQITADDFKFGESPRVPSGVSVPNRNFMNLLEVPVLFYFVSVVGYVTQLADPAAVALAWSYTGLRVFHSVVHLTYNNVMHRGWVFAASNGVLLLIWVRLCIKLIA